MKTCFGEVFKVAGGSQPPKSTFIYDPAPGYVQLLQIRDFGEKPVPTFVREDLVTKFCSEDDILIARYGASLGRILTGLAGAYNVAMAKVIFNRDVLHPKYVFNYLKTTFFQTPLAMMSRSAQNGFSEGELREFVFPLPPLAEQKRIVEKIEELFSELDAGEESLRQARRQLGVYRQSLLKQAFEGKLTAKWRDVHWELLETPKRLLEHIQSQRESCFKQLLLEWEADGRRGRKPTAVTNIDPLTKDEGVFFSNLPSAWVAVPVEAIGSVQLGRQRSPKNKSKDNPTKYVRAANISESGLALDDILEMEFTPQERKTFTLRNGDLLLSEASGSASQVGKPAMWRDEIPNCCFQNTVIRHRLFDPSQSTFYLWLYRYFYNLGIFAQTAGGVGINHLSAGKFSRLPVPLCSLPEQQEIVRLLDEQFSVIEENEREIDAALKRSEALRQSILKKAFTGQLVPQDPSDEPASVLLERIRRDRASADGKMGKKPKRKTRGS